MVAAMSQAAKELAEEILESGICNAVRVDDFVDGTTAIIDEAVKELVDAADEFHRAFAPRDEVALEQAYIPLDIALTKWRKE